ncbi:MAG: aminotransferase class I/II-fold pyridoxal phosphate-dependent enzyme [Kiritimatiellae bacterium]|nr:aminotransferase class I/II-fold pyridoxal phosphate-dependent enzyme [Kiritimatiellia bacterium]
MSDKKRESYIARHLCDVPRSGIRDFFEIVSTRKDVISLGIGEPDFVTPWHIREASMFALDRGATSYTANLGLLELREEVSAYVERTTGVRYDPETEILITVGVSEALDLAVRAVVEPGDEVLYHEPCYVSYAPVVTFAHGVAVPVSTCVDRDFRLDVSALEAACTDRTRMLMLNFPTNPTGAVLQREDLRAIAAFARKRDLVVVTDEIYVGLTYDTEPLSIVSEEGMRERTIYLNGLSKTWAMTGFRVGFACAPASLVEAMMKIHQYTMLCAPVLSQKAAAEALRNGGRVSKEMCSEYRRRRNVIHASLNDMGLTCHLPGGAFYAFPSIESTGLSSKEFSLRLLEEQNVACVPGTAFGACGEGFIRCSYATAMDQIKEAMKRMATFVSGL